MPKRTDIAPILVIDASPIIIGHIFDFDHLGSQEIKAIK